MTLDHLPRALVSRDTCGLVKIVAENTTGRVVGVTLVAPNAGDVILAAVYAIKNQMTVDEMADTWGPLPHRRRGSTARRPVLHPRCHVAFLLRFLKGRNSDG
jgi:pyruvate/2-oxoglutarate dehydrogenase complex dihydrolipoamide dehydrogenase (E3) component